MVRIIQPGDSEASSFNDDSSPDSRLTSNVKIAYRKAFDQILESVLPVDNTASFFRQEVADKKPYALWLSDKSQVFVAAGIVRDSMGARVYSLSKYLSEIGSPLGADNLEEESVLRLSEFGSDLRPLVRRASAWAAKSAATFHEALDCFLEFEEGMRFVPNDIIRRRMKARVLDTHAFDKGDEKHLALLEKARGNILENLNEPIFPYNKFPAGPLAKPYSQTDSKSSYLVQAADIAAGIASRLLETENLVAVVRSFEYVTHNGQRLSVSQAEEEVRRSRC